MSSGKSAGFVIILVFIVLMFFGVFARSGIHGPFMMMKGCAGFGPRMVETGFSGDFPLFHMVPTFILFVVWFALVICSIIKWALLKFGGIKSYNRAVPFFIGLVLGDFVVGCYWGIMSLVIGVPLYTTWF